MEAFADSLSVCFSTDEAFGREDSGSWLVEVALEVSDNSLSSTAGGGRPCDSLLERLDRMAWASERDSGLDMGLK